jgi:hypothetical protein
MVTEPKYSPIPDDLKKHFDDWTIFINDGPIVVAGYKFKNEKHLENFCDLQRIPGFEFVGNGRTNVYAVLTHRPDRRYFSQVSIFNVAR